MSVLRDKAANEEFEETLKLRLTKSDRSFGGIASVNCREVRKLLHSASNQRTYAVLDTDEDGRPHHADIFATFTRTDVEVKSRRSKLLELLQAGFSTPDQFRGGVFDKTQPAEAS